MTMELFDYFVNILGIAVTLLVGAYFQSKYAIFQDRVSRGESQDETRERYRESILNLVQENLDALKTGYTIRSYNHIAFWSILKTDILESIISSTNITLFDTSTQSALTDYLENIKSLNKFTERLEEEDEHSKIVRIFNAQKPKHEALKEASNKLIKILEY